MRFVVTPLRRQGRALARRELGGDAVRGDVTLQHRGECPELGRAAIVAMVRRRPRPMLSRVCMTPRFAPWERMA